jgi:hypothetical protein
MKIEKNIPIAPPRRNGGQYMKYPWDKMKIGDSFIVKDYSYKLQINLCTTGNNWCKRNNPEAKILTRIIGNDLRVFMVSKQ